MNFKYINMKSIKFSVACIVSAFLAISACNTGTPLSDGSDPNVIKNAKTKINIGFVDIKKKTQEIRDIKDKVINKDKSEKLEASFKDMTKDTAGNERENFGLRDSETYVICRAIIKEIDPIIDLAKIGNLVVEVEALLAEAKKTQKEASVDNKDLSDSVRLMEDQLKDAQSDQKELASLKDSLKDKTDALNKYARNAEAEIKILNTSNTVLITDAINKNNSAVSLQEIKEVYEAYKDKIATPNTLEKDRLDIEALSQDIRSKAFAKLKLISDELDRVSSAADQPTLVGYGKELDKLFDIAPRFENRAQAAFVDEVEQRTGVAKAVLSDATLVSGKSFNAQWNKTNEAIKSAKTTRALEQAFENLSGYAKLAETTIELAKTKKKLTDEEAILVAAHVTAIKNEVEKYIAAELVKQFDGVASDADFKTKLDVVKGHIAKEVGDEIDAALKAKIGLRLNALRAAVKIETDPIDALIAAVAGPTVTDANFVAECNKVKAKMVVAAQPDCDALLLTVGPAKTFDALKAEFGTTRGIRAYVLVREALLTTAANNDEFIAKLPALNALLNTKIDVSTVGSIYSWDPDLKNEVLGALKQNVTIKNAARNYHDDLNAFVKKVSEVKSLADIAKLHHEDDGKHAFAVLSGKVADDIKALINQEDAALLKKLAIVATDELKMLADALKNVESPASSTSAKKYKGYLTALANLLEPAIAAKLTTGAESAKEKVLPVSTPQLNAQGIIAMVKENAHDAAYKSYKALTALSRLQPVHAGIVGRGAKDSLEELSNEFGGSTKLIEAIFGKDTKANERAIVTSFRDLTKEMDTALKVVSSTIDPTTAGAKKNGDNTRKIVSKFTLVFGYVLGKLAELADKADWDPAKLEEYLAMIDAGEAASFKGYFPAVGDRDLDVDGKELGDRPQVKDFKKLAVQVDQLKNGPVIDPKYTAAKREIDALDGYLQGFLVR